MARWVPLLILGGTKICSQIFWTALYAPKTHVVYLVWVSGIILKYFVMSLFQVFVCYKLLTWKGWGKGHKFRLSFVELLKNDCFYNYLDCNSSNLFATRMLLTIKVTCLNLFCMIYRFIDCIEFWNKYRPTLYLPYSMFVWQHWEIL